MSFNKDAANTILSINPLEIRNRHLKEINNMLMKKKMNIRAEARVRVNTSQRKKLASLDKNSMSARTNTPSLR